MKKYKDVLIKIFSAKKHGSTLIEALTASVIFMIVFTLSMDILTNLSILEITSGNYVMIENDLNKCKLKIEANSDTNKVYFYKWGKIQLNISEYNHPLYCIEMIAIPHKKGRIISYKFLVKKDI